MREGACFVISFFLMRRAGVKVLTIARSMSVERDIRFDLIARLCPNSTGAELRSVATEVS